MINENDLAELDGYSPLQKFVIIERRMRNKLQDEKRNGNVDHALCYTDMDYMLAVLAAAEAFDIEELLKWQVPHIGAPERDEDCANFLAEATRLSNRYMLQYGLKNNSVALDTNTKNKLSHLLDEIRKTVQFSEVAAEKKDRLFSIINDLQAEIDRERTPIHSVGSLLVSTCTYISQGAEELRPAVKMIERIGVAIGLSKQSEEEQAKLSPRQEPKRIEPPKSSGGFSKAFEDDEIPF